MSEKGLDFTYFIAPDLPENLFGDQANIKKIITNILSNAAKYTDSGFVRYEVNCVNSEDSCKLIISVEDSGRGYRRVVPSPKPMDIIEKNVIRNLVDNDTLVIAVGGGGIPVIKTDKIELLEGVAAVIDKDRSAALLAREIDADMLLILTAVDKVYINYNTPEQMALDELTVEEANSYIESGHFAKGSMLPKVEACMEFVKNSEDGVAIISALKDGLIALNGKTGTRVTK